MPKQFMRGFGRLVGVFLPAAVAVVVGLQLNSGAQPAPAADKPGVLPGASTESLFAHAAKMNLKFSGASNCSNANCHGAAKPNAKGIGAEFTFFSSGKENEKPDPHSKAFESLGDAVREKSGKSGKQIFDAYKKLNAAAGASAATSEKCLTCHAMSPAKAQQGPGYSAEEGVSCGSCHGPDSKWLPLHDKKVGGKLWAEATRETLKHDFKAMLDQFGLYDTKVVQARADKCTSCHLAIDPDMITAGHPQPTFELYYYSASYQSRHWKQEEGFFGAQLWAVGQSASLRDAMYQLAERAGNAKTTDAAVKEAYSLAMSHFSAYIAQFKAGAVTGDTKDMEGWAAALQTAAAGNKRPDMAKAATNVALYVIKLQPTVGAVKFSKATTVGALAQVTKEDWMAKLGMAGAEQQRSAIYALVSALASAQGADKLPDADANALFDQIDVLFKKGVAAGDYAKALTAIQGKLPK